MQSKKDDLTTKLENAKDKRTIVAATIFYLIQVVLFPFAFVGYVLFTIKPFVFSRKSGVSATALAPLYGRYMQHKLGTHLDAPGERLMLALPNVSHLGLRLSTSPTLIAHRLTGYVPKVYRYPYEGCPPLAHEPVARTTFFDAALARHLANIDQFVILGAGWDTRAFSIQENKQVRCFEVDAPRTQEMKRKMLAKVGIDTQRVTFVSADFLKENWLEKLVQAGFEPDKPSFFLWEGVTMYLDQEAVESTLRAIASTASGSAVAFDYFSTEMIKPEGQSLYMRYVRSALAIFGEPLRFGIDSTPPIREQVAASLASCGLSMEEQRNFGKETDQKRVVAGFTTAIVPQP